MKSDDYTFGEAQEVADRLNESMLVSQADLRCALVNALKRIAALETQQAATDKAVTDLCNIRP